MLAVGSSSLAKYHGNLKSSRLITDTLIFNFPLNHSRLWQQMEHSLSGIHYSVILFMGPPLHFSLINGRLMGAPFWEGAPMEPAEGLLRKFLAFLRKRTRCLILVSSPPAVYGNARHPYGENPGTLEAWNVLLHELADEMNLTFIDFCSDMLRSIPYSNFDEDAEQEKFRKAYWNLGKQVLHSLPFSRTWLKRRSGKIHRLLEERRNHHKERMRTHWGTLPVPPHYREETDWITAIQPEKGQAKILLIGGSVMRHLWRPLTKQVQQDIDLFSSTLIPGDPAYLPTLEKYFPSVDYDVIIFSYGSHVTSKVADITVDDFRKNYMAFASHLKKRCRFLVLTTSTSIMDGPDGSLNEKKEKTITAFNAIVQETISSVPGTFLSDSHTFMQGRNYVDSFHFSPEDRVWQATQTVALLSSLLSVPQGPSME